MKTFYSFLGCCPNKVGPRNHQSNGFQEHARVICKSGEFTQEDPAVLVGRKGIESLISASQQRDDKKLYAYLTERLSSEPVGKVVVHKDHRKKFTDFRKLKKQQDDATPPVKKLRSTVHKFEWKTDCLFCGTSAVQGTHQDRKKVFQWRTLHLKERILQQCDVRKDEWGEEVKHHVINFIDLVQVEAVYHEDCKTRFFLHKESTFLSPPKQKGRLWS